ncbi:MAG TPA: cytidylate kinase-like family protein [Chloroflexaceae bacterium]|nr:cytidylate kinase-like family protein [Chloroflexaceae bacterium]
MAVITISRQYGSGGREVAGLVCERLGYRYFDKELMAQLGDELGLAPEQIVDLPDHRHRTQGLLERLFASAINPLGDPSGWALPARLEAQRRTTVQTFQSLIQAAHERGGVVVMGRGGQAVLRGAPDVLHVRLVAPVEQRVARVQRREGLSEDEARARIAERDEAALDYVRRYYDLDAADPLLYDVVLTMDKLTTVAAAELIVRAIAHLLADAPESYTSAAP